MLVARDNLIVEDRDNKCFKVYDKDLNWVNTSVATTFFNTRSSINCMAFCEIDNRLYVCNNRQLYLLNVNSDFSIVSSGYYELDEVDKTDKVIDIKFAHYDKNVFYVLTQKTLIKKWITKPLYNIGVYENTGIKNNLYKWLTNTQSDSGNTIQLYTTSTNLSSNLLIGFNDDTNLISLLQDNFFNIYTIRLS